MPDLSADLRELLSGLKLEPTRESEIIEELNQHLNDRYEELVAQGSSAEEAERTLRHELKAGRLDTQLKSLLPTTPSPAILGEPKSGRSLAGVWKDLRYAARVLRLNPGFSVVAILSLMLGIGANTAIFQLLDAVRLRTLPVENPQELATVRVVATPQGRTGNFVSRNPQLTYAIWDRVRDQQQAFSQIAAWSTSRLNLSQGGEARYAEALWVSGSFFDTLGIRPQLGRLISSADDQPGCGSPGVVISESFWQREFGGGAAIGNKVILERHPFEIIGITPASFFGVEVGRYFDVALPICAEPIFHTVEPWIAGAQTWWLAAIARLKPGWTLERATAHLAGISPGIFEATLPAVYDAGDRKNYLTFKLQATSAASGVSSLRQDSVTPLCLLLAISGLVLLIACANLANLLLARATVRQREMAVRLALGASRSRLIRQLLSESLLLAVVGALCGTGLAQVLSRFLVAFLKTQDRHLALDLHLDLYVLGFSAALAILTCLLFGLAPAFRAARTAPGEAMKANARALTAGRERFGLRRALVVSQIALSLLLVVGALLFVRTLRNLINLDAGFQQDHILFVAIDLSPLKLPVERRTAYRQELLAHVRSMPGVISAADVRHIPLSGAWWNERVTIPASGIQQKLANFNMVSAGYFKTLQTPLLAGRDFNDGDTITAPLAAIVTEAFAREYFNGANPVGKTFGVVQQGGKPDRVYQIIGLVRDVKYGDLREDFSPIAFVAEAQDSDPAAEATVVVVRSDESLADLVSSMKRAVAEVNPALVVELTPFKRFIQRGLLRERLMATLSGFFGLLAALLAMIGLYGVISYMVVRRRNEIGIRMALGASQGNILRVILGEAALLLAAGVAIGSILALLGAKSAQALLFGLAPRDPLTLLVSIGGLSAIAMAASFLPAQRATTIHPMQALREE